MGIQDGHEVKRVKHCLILVKNDLAF